MCDASALTPPPPAGDAGFVDLCVVGAPDRADQRPGEERNTAGQAGSQAPVGQASRRRVEVLHRCYTQVSRQIIDSCLLAIAHRYCGDRSPASLSRYLRAGGMSENRATSTHNRQDGGPCKSPISNPPRLMIMSASVVASSSVGCTHASIVMRWTFRLGLAGISTTSSPSARQHSFAQSQWTTRKRR